MSSLTAQSTAALQIEGAGRKKRAMPIGSYFKGHGAEVKDSMEKTYPDPKKAKQVFYATANKTGMTPGNKANKPNTKTVGQRLAEMAGKR